MYLFRNPQSTIRNFHGREARWFAALLLLAFFVRALPALVPHFWFDEIYTVAIAQYNPGQIVHLTAADAHPPLYYFLVRFFVITGLKLGGVFATLAWLRLASILPGLLACLLGWWAARRAWGRRAASEVLTLFAVSPALSYFSVELRNYALIHALLLTGLLGLMMLTDPRRPRRRAGAGLFGGAMVLALYSHSLAMLYLGAMGIILLAELILADRTRRGALLPPAAAALGGVALLYLPWLPVVLRQNGRLNQLDLAWLPWAEWRDLATAFFWFLPLGPLNLPGVGRGWTLGAMTLLGAGFFLLLGTAIHNRRPAQTGSGHSQAPLARRPDRLLIDSAVLTVLPLLAAFTLSHFHLARVFLGYRFNLLAAPFFTLFVAGLLIRLRRPRWRALALAVVLAFSALAGGYELHERTVASKDFMFLTQRYGPDLFKAPHRFYWTDPSVLPWLGRYGPLAIGSLDQALASPPAGDAYFMTHAILGHYSALAKSETLLLEKILTLHNMPRLDLTGSEDWNNVWRLGPRDLPPLANAWRAARAAIEARRNGIAGGQRLLADDPAFRFGQGWSVLDYNPDLMPECWTEGPRQRLDWPAPARPGRYRLRLLFWRGHPYPEKEITLRYRLPGQSGWHTQKAGLGSVAIEGDIAVTRPRQPLRLELETPAWIPAERLPGSDDRRPLGMTLVALELHP